MFIHPASRGVAAHTAGLFRSVRGAKGGFPPWGFPKLRIFTFPPVGAPQAREFSLFPPVGAPQAREFSLFPPWGLPKLGNFHFSPPWGLPKLGNFHFSPAWGLSKLGNFHFSPPWGLPKLGNFHCSPAVTASQAMEFSLFPPLEALQAAEFQIPRQRRLDSPPNPCSLNVFSMFLQWFPSKHGAYTFVAIKPAENIMFDNASNSLISPTVENTAIYSVFFNFSMFQCR